MQSSSRQLTNSPLANASDLPGPWAKTYAANCKKDMLEAYSEWSSSYDEDSIHKFGYVAPRRAADELNRHVQGQGFSKEIRIADIGAGTGLVGQELLNMGYSKVLALDYSPEMLAIAKAKGCYQELHCVDLTDSLDTLHENANLAAGCFDAAVSVGTFTPNHVGIEVLDTVIALVKAGGLLCLSLREDFVLDSTNGFLARLKVLEDCGTISLLDATKPELYTAKVSDTIYFRCWTYRVN
jgi:predicted TPR repeat methyltransferase